MNCKWETQRSLPDGTIGCSVELTRYVADDRTDMIHRLSDDDETRVWAARYSCDRLAAGGNLGRQGGVDDAGILDFGIEQQAEPVGQVFQECLAVDDDTVDALFFLK